MERGDNPFFYVVSGDGHSAANASSVSRAFNVPLDVADSFVKGEECSSAELNPGGLPLQPSVMNSQAILEAFVSLEQSMRAKLGAGVTPAGCVPGVDALDSLLDDSRLHGLMLFMRHRPKHMLRALMSWFPEKHHRYEIAVRYSVSVPWSLPRTAATLLYVTVLPDAVYSLWIDKACALFYQLADLDYIVSVKELHNLIHMTRCWWSTRLDIKAQSYLLYMNALAGRQNWPYKTPEAEEIEKRHAGGIERRSFDGNEYTTVEYQRRMESIDGEEVLAICNKLKHNFVNFDEYAK
eukprot:943108-Amphidinium_carterae.1